MASGVIPPPQPISRRVFVLVDRGQAQGVFCSWDAAEAFADENRIPIDNLLEFRTKVEHPDHFHLLSGMWDNIWNVVGQWSSSTPSWARPPEKIRLHHYHTIGQDFHLLRTKEFPWTDGMLAKINPMAPDRALKLDILLKPGPEPPQWKPSLSPIKPVTVDPEAEKPEPKRLEPIQETPPPFTPEPEPEPVVPVEEELTPMPFVPDTKDESRGLLSEETEIPESHKKPLRLKSKIDPPKPIPEFIPPPVTDEPPQVFVPEGAEPEEPEGPEASEPAASEPVPELPKAQPVIPYEPEDDEDVTIRWKWPLRLYVAFLVVIACWGFGIYRVLKAEPTAHSLVRDVNAIARAETVTIEPAQLLFEMRILEARVQYWRHSLALDSIPAGAGFELPKVASLIAWEMEDRPVNVNQLITDYSAPGSIEQWWADRRTPVNSGFFRSFPDGSLILLDVDTLTISGWTRVENLPDIFQ